MDQSPSGPTIEIITLDPHIPEDAELIDRWINRKEKEWRHAFLFNVNNDCNEVLLRAFSNILKNTTLEGERIYAIIHTALNHQGLWKRLNPKQGKRLEDFNTWLNTIAYFRYVQDLPTQEIPYDPKTNATRRKSRSRIHSLFFSSK
jgi:hypothetical protein